MFLRENFSREGVTDGSLFLRENFRESVTDDSPVNDINGLTVNINVQDSGNGNTVKVQDSGNIKVKDNANDNVVTLPDSGNGGEDGTGNGGEDGTGCGNEGAINLSWSTTVKLSGGLSLAAKVNLEELCVDDFEVIGDACISEGTGSPEEFSSQMFF